MSVCLSVGIQVNTAKTGELIEMRFQGLTRVGPRNHVEKGRGNFVGFSVRLKAFGDCAAVYAANVITQSL